MKASNIPETAERKRRLIRYLPNRVL